MSAEIINLVSNLAKASPPMAPIVRHSLDEHMAKREQRRPGPAASHLITPSSPAKPQSPTGTKRYQLPAEDLALLSSASSQPLPADASVMEQQFEQTLNTAYEELPKDEFKTTVFDSIEKYYEHAYAYLSRYYKEHTKHNHLAFIASLSLLTLGTVVICTGVIFIFFANFPWANILMFSGAVVDVVAAIIFGFNIFANHRLDQIAQELDMLGKTRTAMGYIDQIADSDKKGKAIEKLLRDIAKAKPLQGKTIEKLLLDLAKMKPLQGMPLEHSYQP